MFRKLMQFLVLPKEISEFEVHYLERMNRIAFLFFALHVPALTLLAAVNHTNPLLAAVLSLGVMAGPVLAKSTLSNPRSVSLVYGLCSMLMGGLLAHFGQGPVQIEMHFYFFALLAMLAVFANPMVIVTAAVAVAVHHLGMWLLLPSSVFNYDAPIWVVAIHAAFVVLESVATCFIARSFFDNVIGLDKIVQQRTAQLDVRNRDMRLVLDHVEQGFLTIDRAGVMSAERSKIVSEWLGPASDGARFVDYLAPHSASAAENFAMGWEQVLSDVLPLELVLDQLPRNFTMGVRHFRLDYTPILAGDQLQQMLIVISNVTSDYERERLELEQRDVMRILGRLAADKNGVLEFFQEAGDQIKQIAEARADARTQKRLIHTLKGNSMIFGVQAIAKLCEQMETRFHDTGELPSSAERGDLSERWTKLCASLDLLLGERKSEGVEIDDGEYEGILGHVLRGAPREEVAVRIRSWRLEPTQKRLARIGEQARALAQRTGKGDIAIDTLDNSLRLDSKRWAPFWASFTHVVRNAVDHGLEPESERATAGKPVGTVYLSTRLDRGDLVVELSDNGRGVNWAAVAQKARERGLPHATRGDLVEALFSDGLTTLDEATEYSGRGVGMAAVRATCQQLGGEVTVLDREGGGTTVQFRFPTPEEKYVARRPSIAAGF
jgi:two-component system, chemotaxis family, sensor kinase CheA